MARVTVTVNVRDLTQAQLAQMRHNFRALGQDMTNVIGARTRQNWARLSQSIVAARRDLTRLRGNIPDAEFMRMDDAIRRAQRTMQRGFSNVGARSFARLVQQVREVTDGFQRLDQAGQIRVTVDNSALARADAQLARWRAQQQSRTVQIRIDTDRATGQASSRIRRWAMGPLRGLGGLISGTLSDGLGQGLVGAFRSPTFGLAIVAALTAVASLAGAAMAGAMVLAIGGGFVGLGMFIAAKSKEVTRNWEAEMKRLKPVFEKAAEPMIPVLTRATHMLGQMGDQFAPKFEQALTRAAPAVNGFIDRTKVGFQKLGENAWNDLQSAFNTFTVAFGPEWENFLAEFGKSLGALARTVREHSTEMAMALRAILGVINLIIDTINFLANAWVMFVHGFIAAAAAILDSVALILDGFLGMIDGMIGAFESFAGLFGFEDEAARAREAFNQVRNEAVSKFSDMSAAVKQLGTDIDYNNRRRKLEVDIASWTAELERAKSQLGSVPPEKESQLRADISNLEANISRAQGQLASMRKDYYVRIHAYRVGDWALGFGGPGQAHGGVTGNHIGRAATGGARSNMTLVGEHGPEFVDLAPGSHVRSNSDSRRLMNQEMSVGSGTTLVIRSSGRRVDDLLLEVLRDAIHRAGGDPVTVLGGR